MLPTVNDETDGATGVVKDPDLTPAENSSSKEACTWYSVSALRPVIENCTGDDVTSCSVSVVCQAPEVPAR